MQLLTRAARSNPAAPSDDSHSNLGWNPELFGFLSHPMTSGSGDYHVALSLHSLRLFWCRDGQTQECLELPDCSVSEATQWLDTQLRAAELCSAASIHLPYEIPPQVARIDKIGMAKTD